LNSVTPLTSEQVQILEKLCNKLCNEPKIRFCGVINSLGRIVTGGFRDDIRPLDNEDQRRMLYMQSTLELSMKREFDDNLGNVDFITTYRDNVALINIPIQQNHLLLISVERNAEIERIHKRFSPLVKICKEEGAAMRVGTNHGSLSDRIMSRYGDTPLGMVESALEFLRICEHHNYYDVVLSMKSSNTQVMVQAYRLLVNKMMECGMNYPLHIGVTEAGEGEDGRIKSAKMVWGTP